MPFGEYVRAYLQKSGLLDPSTFKTRAQVEPVLAGIRAMYARVTVPQATFDMFEKLILKDASSPLHISRQVPRMRLRSSTNSEDLPGFTGAYWVVRLIRRGWPPRREWTECTRCESRP